MNESTSQGPEPRNSSSLTKSSAAERADLFLTTRWTVVLAAGARRTTDAAQALEELCRTYWYPLYAFVRHRGYSREDAEDLVQGFFVRLLGAKSLEGVSSEKGKFRAFLLASLKHFLANEWDKNQRQKRGGHVLHLSLDWRDADNRYAADPADCLSPDKLYDRAWAVTLLERVLARLREENHPPQKRVVFEQLKPFLTVGKSAIPYAEAGRSLEMTEAAARVAVHRLRRRYRELLREEIAQTLAEPQQVEAEMRTLLGAFAA